MRREVDPDVATAPTPAVNGKGGKGKNEKGVETVRNRASSTQRPPETESSVASMAGAITSPDLAIAASKVVRASRLLSKNITNPAGYVPSVSPADAPAFLRCPSDIEKSRWAAGRPWSYHRRVCVQALNSLRLIDLVPRIRGRHPQAAIEPCSSAAETTSNTAKPRRRLRTP